MAVARIAQAGAVVFKSHRASPRVLLVTSRRNPELWILPKGHIEPGEKARETALRETREEAGANIELGGAFSMISVPRVNQVHVFYRARLLDLEFNPGEESLEVGMFDEQAIPWKDIAFRTVALTLKHWFADRARGRFGFHAEDIPPL